MNNRTKTIILIAAFVLFFAVALFAYNALGEGGSPPKDGDGSGSGENKKIKASDFTVYDGDGREVKLSELFGKPIVLNFWASWCSPCKAEMPGFDEVYGEVSGEVAFIMVNLTDGVRETREKAAKYVSDNGFSFPVYFDTRQEAAYAYGVRAIPMTVFIDADGYIASTVNETISAKILLDKINLIK